MIKYLPWLSKLAGLKTYALVFALGSAVGGAGVYWLFTTVIESREARDLREAVIARDIALAGLQEEYNKQNQLLLSSKQREQGISKKYQELYEQFEQVNEDEQASEWTNSPVPNVIDDFLYKHEGKRGCTGSETEASGCTTTPM